MITVRIQIPGQGTYWARKEKGRNKWWTIVYPESDGTMIQQMHGGSIRDIRRDVQRHWPQAIIKKVA